MWTNEYMATYIMGLYQNEKKETGDFPKKKIWDVRWGRSGRRMDNEQLTKSTKILEDGIIQTLVTLSHGHSTHLEVLDWYPIALTKPNFNFEDWDSPSLQENERSS